jgi:hypothetical protein
LPAWRRTSARCLCCARAGRCSPSATRSAASPPCASRSRYRPAFAALPAAECDVRPHWPDDRHLDALLIHAAGMAADAAHARRLADRPGVRIQPVAGVGGHNTFLPAFASGAFEAALDDMLARA